jgi:hypothetical protein
MEKVYRATNAKLKRDISIEVLPGVAASEEERVAKCEREATRSAEVGASSYSLLCVSQKRWGRSL